MCLPIYLFILFNKMKVCTWSPDDLNIIRRLHLLNFCFPYEVTYQD